MAWHNSPSPQCHHPIAHSTQLIYSSIPSALSRVTPSSSPALPYPTLPFPYAPRLPDNPNSSINSSSNGWAGRRAGSSSSSNSNSVTNTYLSSKRKAKIVRTFFSFARFQYRLPARSAFFSRFCSFLSNHLSLCPSVSFTKGTSPIGTNY